MLVDLVKPEIEVALKALKSYPTLDPIDEKVYLRLIDRLEEFKQIAWNNAVSVKETDVAVTSIAFAAKMKGRLAKSKEGGGFAALAAAKAAKAQAPG